MPLRKGLAELMKNVLEPVDPEAEKSFSTYLNYLTQIRNCLEGLYGVNEDLVKGLVTAVRGSRSSGRYSIASRMLQPGPSL